MTKEELEKEAEEKLSKVELDYCHGFMNPCEPNELPYIELVRFRTGFERGYIAGAEPREKQLDEFRKENAELKAKIYGGGYDAVIAKKDADIILLEKQNSELKKQIEKMKCCHNCKNCAYAGFEIICRTYDCINHSRWEIKEK